MSLFTDVLDAGDRLAAALDTGDLDQVEAAIEDRQWALDALARADLGAPPPALSTRAQRQALALAERFRQRAADLSATMAATSRAATAQERYKPSPRQALVDTARR